MQKTIFVIFLLLVQIVSSQEIVILDRDTGEPILNVAIYNSEKSKTVLSDFDGKCNLSVFDKNERISFKHISYKTYKSSRSQIFKQKNKVYLVLKPEQLDEVVMSVSKWEQQKKDIPNKIVSIDTRQIAFTNPQTSADLLQQSGKVFVQKSQLGGGSPIIRGLATNRVLITVDGVRMNNAIFRGGNVQNIISIDPFSVKNTEVIFGPGSVIYGSDAIGGVMNFYTKKAIFSTDSLLRTSGNLNYRYTSANMEHTFHFDINLGRKKWAFLTSATYNDFDDLTMGKNGPESYLRNNYVIRRNGQDELIFSGSPRVQKTTNYNQINLMQKIAYKPNNTWNYDLGFFYTKTSDYSRYDRLIRPNTTRNGLRSAEWLYGPQEWLMSNLQINKKGKDLFYSGLKITTAYQHFEESRHERNFQNPIRNITKENVDAFSTSIDFENKKIGNLKLYYGLEYVFNKVGSNGRQKNIDTNIIVVAASRYPDGATWQTAASYINAKYKAKPNLTLLTGLRYSRVWANADFNTSLFSFPFENANFNTGALTGSIGFSWFPKADLQCTWNGSTGFRSPNIDDIGKVFDSEPGSVVVPNLNLEPEYAYNTEIAIQKNFKNKIVIKGATYYTYLADALVRRGFEFNGATSIVFNGELSNVQAIQNAAKAYIYGFELGLEVFLSDYFSINSNLTFTKGTEVEDNGFNSPGRHVTPTFGDFHLVWKNQKLHADLFLNYNGEISFNDLAPSERNKAYLYANDSNGNPYSPSWYTVNFRSQYSISTAIKTTLSIENITNQRYRPYSSGISAPGTNLILGLGYRF